MARPKKPITIFKEALVNLSYREKLKEYLRLYFVEYDSSVDEKLELIYKSFSPTERKVYDNYYSDIFACILNERYRFLLIISNVDNYSLFLNNALKEIDEYEHSVLFINSILATIKDKATGESPEEKVKEKSYTNISERLREFYSVSDGVKIYKTNYYLDIDYTPYQKQIDRAINSLNNTLSTAKGFSTALQEFIDTYKINDLIPEEIREFENMYKQDLSSQWWNSSKVYKEYSSKENKNKEDEDTIKAIQESKLYPNLFPDYDNVEPNIDLIGKHNIFINKCAVTVKI